MRNSIVSAVLITATLGFGGAAMAQDSGNPLRDIVTTIDLVGQQSTGVITSIDRPENAVTLADGQIYDLPKGFNMGLLTNGQKVALDWHQVGGALQVRSLQFSAS